MKITGKRSYMLEIVLAAIAIVCIAGAIVVYRASSRRVGSLTVEVERLVEENLQLEAQLAEVGEPQSGGAESRGPAPQTISSEWTFPIAESDYLMLTSPFGYRVSPILGIELYHEGVDIAATWRAQVVAVADGTVVEHWPPPDGYYRGHDVLGGLVIIEHDEGWRSAYAHLSSTRVNTGGMVSAGEVIGRVGGTGQSRGEHLHFELREPNGTPVNPALYITTNLED